MNQFFLSQFNKLICFYQRNKSGILNSKKISPWSRQQQQSTQLQRFKKYKFDLVLDQKFVTTYNHDFSPVAKSQEINTSVVQQSERQPTESNFSNRVLRFKNFCSPKTSNFPDSTKQLTEKISKCQQQSKRIHQFYTPLPTQKDILNQKLGAITQQIKQNSQENQSINQKYLTEPQEDNFQDQFNELLDLISVHQKEFPRIIEENLSYFCHFLGLCECYTCDCGFCRCDYVISPKPLKLPLQNGLVTTYCKSFAGKKNQDNSKSDLKEITKVLKNYSALENASLKQIDTGYSTENKASLREYNNINPTPKFIPSKPLSETPFFSLSTYKSQFLNWKGSPQQNNSHLPDQKRIYCQVKRENSLYQSSFSKTNDKSSDAIRKTQLKHIGPFQLFLPFLSSSENKEKFTDCSQENYLMNQHLQKDSTQKNYYPQPYIAQKTENQKNSEISTYLQKKYCSSKYESHNQTKASIMELINKALQNRAQQNQLPVQIKN